MGLGEAMEVRQGVRGQLTYVSTVEPYKGRWLTNGRLCDVPCDQPQGYQHIRFGMFGQDRYGTPVLQRTTPTLTAITVKIWSLGSSTPNFQLEAHETKGVNHVDYYPHSDKPYLLTTSDDVGCLPRDKSMYVTNLLGSAR